MNMLINFEFLLYLYYAWFIICLAIMILAILLSGFSPLSYFNIIVVLAIHWALCSMACLFFQYCFSYGFKKENIAYVFLLFMNIFPVFYIITEAKKKKLDADPAEMNPDARVAYIGLEIIYDIFSPQISFISELKALISFGLKHQGAGYSISFGNILSIKNGVVHHFYGAGISILFYGFILVYLTKLNYYSSRRGVVQMNEEIESRYEKEIKEKDDDLYQEYKRVKEDIGETKEDKNSIPMKFVNLTQEYDGYDFSTKAQIVEAMNKPKASRYGEFHLSEYGTRRVVMTAFENVNFGINHCECFGILGPNGSGKSSFLNTATFLLKQTLGDIYYDGINTLDRHGNEISVGFCAQEDIVWEELSLFEHIQMYLLIRGYSLKESRKLANQFIDYCRLTSHKDKFPHELSGGNLRKLNILMAICSSFKKVMLDEPTAGMDASTRYYIWDIIKESIQRNHSSIIMTTHSMEEAEALCQRLAILVNGKLQCIGSPEHLKIKYSHSYLLDVQTDDVDTFHQKVVIERNLFNGANYQREIKSLQHVKYEVFDTSNISKVFVTMEECRKEDLFIDYSYSQTTLEQVFLNFAALKENDDEL